MMTPMMTIAVPAVRSLWATTALCLSCDCIGCNQCSPHCPQRINIPHELHRIDAFVERLKQHLD